MKLLDFVFAARPLLHLPIWSIYLVSLHYHLALSDGAFALSDLGLMGLLSLMAAGGYYLNQVYDIDGDSFNNKLGFIEREIISAKTMHLLFILLSVVTIGLSYLYSFTTFVIFVQLFLLSYLYSAPPFRLKDRPISGLFANAYAFGIVVPLAIMPDLGNHNNGLLGRENPFYFFFAVAAIYLLTTIPDRRGDRLVGKKTIAVVLGPRLTILAAIVLLLASAFFGYYAEYAILVYVSLFSIFPALAALLFNNDRITAMAAKLPILLLTILAGYFFWGYLLFVVALIILTRIYYFKRFGIIYPQLA